MSMHAGDGSRSSIRARTERAGLRVVTAASGRGGPEVQARVSRWPWAALALDVILLEGESALSELTRRVPLIEGLVSLGGHPLLVKILAGASLVVLVLMAPLTQGFTRSTTVTQSVLAIAGMLTLIACAGILVVIVTAPLVLLMVARGGRIVR